MFEIVLHSLTEILYIFKVGNLLNIFTEHDLYIIILTHTMAIDTNIPVIQGKLSLKWTIRFINCTI